MTYFATTKTRYKIIMSTFVEADCEESAKKKALHRFRSEKPMIDVPDLKIIVSECN